MIRKGILKMKKKYMSTVGLSALLLALFLPVFYFVIVYGANMNYNELHKIVTAVGNKALLLCVIIGACLLGVAFFFIRKIPYTRRSAAIFVACTFAFSVAFYIINSNVSKCIAFYGGWDCGMVANSARWIYEGGDLGYDDYYTIFSNNIPVTWVLYKLYSLASSMTDYPYNPEFIWIQYQCVLLTVAFLCSALTTLVISRNIGISVIALVFSGIFLGLSPWKIIPYTDGCSIVFPILLLFLYSLFRKSNRLWCAYTLWFLIMLTGCMGGIMKATCYVTLIAILLVDLYWTITDDTTILVKLKKTGCKFLLLIFAFFLASLWKQEMYRELDYHYDSAMESGWSNFMYDGLNEETTGACSDGGMELVRAYAGQPKELRVQKELEGIRQRMQERGFGGQLFFWLRKQVMSFNDGTFSWHQEGFFHAWDYPELTNSKWKAPLRSFYWLEGGHYILFTTLSQLLWFFVLVGIILEAFFLLDTGIEVLKKKRTADPADTDSLCLSAVMLVTFIGMFLFIMLFEGRARYLYNTVPVFAVMAVLGYCKLYRKFCIFFDSKRG